MCVTEKLYYIRPVLIQKCHLIAGIPFVQDVLEGRFGQDSPGVRCEGVHFADVSNVQSVDRDR